MEKKQRTKKQHFVPESYLKNFLNKSNELFTLDFTKVKKGWAEFPKRNTPGGVCYLEDYYTIQEYFPENFLNLKQNDPLFIEDTVLTKLENRYPELFKSLITTNKISLQLACELSDFIINLKLRNPYWFENVIKKNIGLWTDKLLPEIIAKGKIQNDAMARLPKWAVDFIGEELKNQQASDPDFAKQFMIFSLRERYFDHTDRNKLMRKKTIDCTWNILTTPENGPYFITTDNPGAAVGKKDKLFHTIKLEGGFIFYFPLSPRYCLVFTDSDKDFAYQNNCLEKEIRKVEVGSSSVIQINDILINVASKVLIATDNWYLSALANINKPKK